MTNPRQSQAAPKAPAQAEAPLHPDTEAAILTIADKIARGLARADHEREQGR